MAGSMAHAIHVLKRNAWSFPNWFIASQESTMKDVDMKLLEASKSGDFDLIQVGYTLILYISVFE